MVNEINKMAILVDTDNIQANKLGLIIKELKKYGNPVIKRLYGDFSKESHKAWRDISEKHGFKPIMQYCFTKGKNSTDSSLIIDAMDILYNNDIDIFTIISSDGDFTRLAGRIREENKQVIGVGEKKTPKALQNNCDIFIFIEDLKRPSKNKQPSKNKIQDIKSERDLKLRNNKVLMEKLQEIILDTRGKNNFSNMAAIATHIKKLMPDFRHKSHGYSKLSSLINATGLIFLTWRGTKCYCRLKNPEVLNSKKKMKIKN